MKILRILREGLKNLFNNKEAIRLNLEDAKRCEETQAYEDACYSYACAINQGEKDQKYKERIKYLFNTHGPFTFEKQLERMKKEYCDCDDSCGEGYHWGIVKLIKKIMDE